MRGHSPPALQFAHLQSGRPAAPAPECGDHTQALGAGGEWGGRGGNCLLSRVPTPHAQWGSSPALPGHTGESACGQFKQLGRSVPATRPGDQKGAGRLSPLPPLTLYNFMSKKAYSEQFSLKNGIIKTC